MNKPRMRRRCAHPRRGAAVVEMAFAAPVLFLILFGVVEFGRAYMVQHLIEDSAREGCRIAILPNSSNAAVESAVSEALIAKGINGAALQILVNNAAADVSSAKAGDDIEIRVSVANSNISLIPPQYLYGDLTANCVRRKE